MTWNDWLAHTTVWSLASDLYSRRGKRERWLFTAACLRRVWELLDSESNRLAVEACERYADGQADRVDLLRVWTSAEFDTGDGLWGEHAGFSEVTDGEEDAPGFLVGASYAEQYSEGTAARAAFHARELVAWHAGPDRRGEAVAEEQRAQFLLWRDLFARPPGTIRLNPAWLAWEGGTVPKLAKALYAGRDWNQLPILADALEEAGCDDHPLLDHFRGGGVHARGCWAVDIILAKDL